MNQQQAIIKKTIEFAKNFFAGEGSGHDWFHTERVLKTALHLAKKENADEFIVAMAALLHDVADWKLNGGDEAVGIQRVEEWLVKCEVHAKVAEKIIGIIALMSFSKETDGKKLDTIEGFVVQDADRLDAMGAIGIARTFAFGGNRSREIHNPDQKPRTIASFEEYKNTQSTSVNHFYEKLFLLKDRLNTAAAKKVGEKRHEFMKQFLEEFLCEWDGADVD